jgi:hypothetical protein
MQGLTPWRKVIVQRCWRSPCRVAGEGNRTNPGSRQALVVALSFCRLINGMDSSPSQRHRDVPKWGFNGHLTESGESR